MYNIDTKKLFILNLKIRELKKQLEKLQQEKESIENPKIEVLCLSPRSTNALSRVGIKTIYELLDYYASGKDIASIRNIGEESKKEIELAIQILLSQNAE